MLPLLRIVTVVLLLLFGWMALGGSSRVGVTADETAHLTAGYSYWTEGDYRLQPENGNFPQRWAALPSVLRNTPFPSLDSEAWGKADVWFLGREFFYGIENSTANLLFSGRAMIVLMGMVLVLLSALWSQQLHGTQGALVTLGLVVFCPHLLAHSALITSDIAATLGFLLALGAWWKLCHRITIKRIIALGVATGFLALAKFSAALFVPMAIFVLIARSFRSTPLPWKMGPRDGRLHGASRSIALLGAGAASATLAIVLIWNAYGFRYAATDQPGHHFVKPWSEVLIEETKIVGSLMADGQPLADPVHLKAGPVQSFVRWARDHQVLPEAYLYGLAFTDLHSRGRLAFFAGEYRETGWWNFFPVAFIFKTTFPALLILSITCLAFSQATPAIRKRELYRLTPLMIFMAVYWVFALTSHLNIGHRHLLPIYPALYICAGFLGQQLTRKRGKLLGSLTIALLIGHAGVSLHARPHYLTYFNLLAGGSSGGHRYFVDSSMDWGQGLPDLHAWLQQNHDDEPLYLSSFGSDDPQRFPINATRIGDIYFDFSSRQILPELKAGTYCISATMLHRVYTQVRGPWSAAYENAYHQFAKIIATSDPSSEQLQTFAQLRFGRLCHYLEQRSPDALVGNTFFIYRLTDEEIDHAINAPLSLSRLQPHTTKAHSKVIVTPIARACSIPIRIHDSGGPSK